MTPSAPELVRRLTLRGVALSAAGDRLRWRSPAPLSAADLDDLRARKAEILALLRDADPGTGVHADDADASPAPDPPRDFRGEPPRPCPACSCRARWRGADTWWNCAACHPPAAAIVGRVVRAVAGDAPDRSDAKINTAMSSVAAPGASMSSEASPP